MNDQMFAPFPEGLSLSNIFVGSDSELHICSRVAIDDVIVNDDDDTLSLLNRRFGFWKPHVHKNIVIDDYLQINAIERAPL